MTTSFVGSMRESVPASWFTAQIEPNPAVMPSGSAPTVMRPTTRPVAGSMRATLLAVSSTVQIEPKASTMSIGDATGTVPITFAVRRVDALHAVGLVVPDPDDPVRQQDGVGVAGHLDAGEDLRVHGGRRRGRRRRWRAPTLGLG